MNKQLKASLAVLATTIMLHGTALAAEEATTHVDPTFYPTYELKVYQPMIQLKNPAAQKAVNYYMMDLAETIQKDAREWIDHDTVCDAQVHSAVTFKNDAIISIVTNGYLSVANSAHPASWRFGHVFDKTTGKVLTLDDIAALPEFKSKASHYTLNNVRKSLKHKYGPTLYSDPSYIKEMKMPEDIYIDSDGCVHVVVQVYELGPYAAGLLDVNLDVVEDPVA